jgi:pimeloyl-ACP methyl ester carboxylesterase
MKDGRRPDRIPFGGMALVLVNGNPETAAIWRPLIADLGRDDIVTLAPPGFGAPLPDGFGASYDEYVAWLIGEIELIGEPVDLVGHDWGANFSLRLACERPDLLHSWSIDTAGCFAPDFAFDDVPCHTWQTPGAGEQAIAAWLAMGVEDRTSLNESMGMTPEVARELAEALDDTMGRCILAVYRSVPEAVLASWGQKVATASTRPGLVIFPAEDEHTGGEARHRWVAERAGAKVAVLEGVGHWWMLQDPVAGADALQRFWDAI